MAPLGKSWVVVAEGVTDRGQQFTGAYLHKPFTQATLGSGGLTEAIPGPATEFSPLLPVSTDQQAIDLAERLSTR